MSTAVASPGQSAEVARARIGVLIAGYQVDVVVPTKFTIETFIDDLLVVLAEAIDDAEVDYAPPVGQWSLARPGSAPLPRWQSLADHHIVDGTVLMLSVVESAEVFNPIVEDVTDALALINEREFAEYDAPTSAITGLVALFAGAVVAATLLAWSWTDSGSLLYCGVPALLLGAICWGGAVSAWRRASAPRLHLGLALCSVPLLFAGGAMLVPPADGVPGSFAAANFAAGAVVAATAAAVIMRLTGNGIAVLVAITTGGIALALAAIPLSYTDVSLHQVCGGVLLAGLVLLTAAPRLAVIMARIQPPDLPDPGSEVTPPTLTDIFDAESVAAEQDRDQPGAADRRARLGDTGIESRARRAVASLRGLISATAVLLAGGSVIAAATAPGGVREILVAVAVAAVLVMRARWYPDRVQSLALIGAAGVIVAGLGGVLIGAYDSAPVRLIVVAAVVGAACVGCLAATRLVGRRLSPVTRRLIDLVEYALILVVPVLACWIAGIYTAMRSM
ncbi:type VII secretion integral membrane protein EccD [Nocardia colli]|uniref:Type VII secretion integral membrane protein EccD n=1 Tax=Nocardia colli TaxID=2545717 RepID=A0A5N0DXQ0_9NOCA|nr:type VII secretion integral membrane protein EccD [Nocardia colli]KAA8881918.1 type VII secretion integral membrane protein EccD [Nocardia colli]